MPGMTTSLAPERYLALVDTDTQRLIEVAERGVDAAVPTCPGWTVGDLLDHVAHVYEHKVRVMSAAAWPDDWPPAEYAGREPIGFLSEASDHLFTEFARHEPSELTATFGDDDTITFWMRRMALEVAIHRLDGELAHGDPTPIDSELALDGIDEFLRVMLAGDWQGETEHPVDATVAVESAGLRWQGAVSGTTVTMTPASADPAEVTVSGAAEVLFRWLWGRSDDDRVQIEGDPEVVREVKARLVEAAQ